MASRKIEDLTPSMQEKTKKFLELAKQNGIEVLIYCTYRSPEEQEVLYMQGRLKQFGLTLQQLNEKRAKLGLYPLSENEASKIITYAKPGQSKHNTRQAFDCVPIIGGKPQWNNIDLYKKLGLVGKQVGLSWAGEWKKFKEYPHFEDIDKKV